MRNVWAPCPFMEEHSADIKTLLIWFLCIGPSEQSTGSLILVPLPSKLPEEAQKSSISCLELSAASRTVFVCAI